MSTTKSNAHAAAPLIPSTGSAQALKKAQGWGTLVGMVRAKIVLKLGDPPTAPYRPYIIVLGSI